MHSSGRPSRPGRWRFEEVVIYRGSSKDFLSSYHPYCHTTNVILLVFNPTIQSLLTIIYGTFLRAGGVRFYWRCNNGFPECNSRSSGSYSCTSTSPSDASAT